MSDFSAGGTRHCLDCGAPLQFRQRFCSMCGQPADTHRLTTREIGHDLLHALVHADRSAYTVIKALVTRPGHVAREFVAGKRRRHFGPFASLVILTAITTLLVNVTGFHSITSPNGLNALQSFEERHLNLIVLAQVPLLSLFFLVVFRRERLNYAEHIVLATYAFCLRALIFCVLILPLWYVERLSPTTVGYLSAALWCPYVGLATLEFYSGNRFASWLKGATAAALTLVVSNFILDGASRLYTFLFHP